MILKFGFAIFSGIGNAVLSTPMLRALRSMHPESEINVFTWERCAEVFRGLPFIDGVFVSFDYLNNNVLDFLLISPLDGCPKFLSLSTNKTIKINKTIWEKHESEYNMDLVRKLGYSGSTPKPIITSPDSGPQEKYAVISIGFVNGEEWHLKQIKNNEEWLPVCSYLIDNGYRVFFLGVKKDYKIAQKIILKLPNDEAVNACGLTSIKQSVAIIRKASIFVGLDCGLAHIASCFEIPSVLAWTFTDLLKNKPLNRNLKIIEIECSKKRKCQYGSWKSCQNKICRNLTSDMIINGIKKYLT